MIREDQSVQQLLGRLVDAASSVFMEEEKQEVRELLDANENLLALETLVGIFVEERKTVPSEVLRLTEDATNAMSDGRYLIRMLRRSS